MKLPHLYILVFISFASSVLNAQYVFPKLPVESKLLDKESSKIIEGGFKLKQDIRYIIQEGKVTTAKYSEKETEYDDKGRIKEVVVKDKNGRTKLILIYLYQTNGLPKRITRFHPTGDILGRFEFKYDNDGFLVERIEYDQYDYVVQKILYQKNMQENTITESYFDSPEMVTKKIQWTYTDLTNGRLTSVSEFSGESVLKIKKQLIYEGNKLIKEQFMNSYGGIIYYHSYTYDSDGNITEIKKELPGGNSIKKQSSQYNGLGLITGEIKYDSKGRMKTYYKFNYQ